MWCLLLLCVVYYRHHTNPVGTEWRWQMDDPELVFNGALENHVNMIKQFKGTVLQFWLNRNSIGYIIQESLVWFSGEELFFCDSQFRTLCQIVSHRWFRNHVGLIDILLQRNWWSLANYSEKLVRWTDHRDIKLLLRKIIILSFESDTEFDELDYTFWKHSFDVVQNWGRLCLTETFLLC